MPSNEESVERVSTVQPSRESSADAAPPAHPVTLIEGEPVFIGQIPDGYEIPYGVTVHLLQPDETGALHDHRVSEDSIMRVDSVTGERQEIYHGQVIDAQHPPQPSENQPTPEPIFVGQLPENYQIPYGQTVHVLRPDETGALHDRRVTDESIMRVDSVTGERQEIYHGQVIDAQHPPQASENQPASEPVFVGQLPENYQMPYGQTVHLLRPNEDGALVDHRMDEESFLRTDPVTGERQEIYHGQVIDVRHPADTNESPPMPDPVFVADLAGGYDLQPGLDVHVIEASPDGDLAEHRMSQESLRTTDQAAAATFTPWFDRHDRGASSEANAYGGTPSGDDGAAYDGSVHTQAPVADDAPYQASHGREDAQGSDVAAEGTTAE